jgi:hypothetical protein
MDASDNAGVEQMIGLLEAAQIASVLGNATNIVDKLYNRFFEARGQPPPSEALTEHSAKIVDHPQQKAIVSAYKGNEVQRVTYEQLAHRLETSDFRFVKTKEQYLDNLMALYDGIHPQIAVSSADEAARLRLRESQILTDMSSELGDILRFLEEQCKIDLDDHYHVFRHLTGR